MAKETRATDDSQVVAKKRRVTKPLSSAESTPVAKSSDADFYTKLVNVEENEAKERNPEDDAKLYYKTCMEIRELLATIAVLKTKHSSEVTQNEIKEKQIQACIKIVSLKKLNRLEKVRTKDSRYALQQAREQVDSDHLQLQNLLYEVVHLNKEVKKCLEFKSKDEEMDLVPISDFFEKAPESVSKPSVTKNDTHQLRLARLHWEIMQRKELAVQCKQLEASKESVGKDIDEKKKQLNNLAPLLKTVLDATKPLQDRLGVNIDKTKRLHAKAVLLPKPLYVLYVQADAFSHCEQWLSVTILGECDKAVTEELHLDDISSDDSDSDDKADLPHRRKMTFQDRRKSEVSNLSDRLEQKKKECLKKHPLSVALKMSLSSGECLTVELQWLVVLEMVCVLPSISGFAETNTIAAEDLIAPHNILSSLWPGDSGEELPNPSSLYQLQRAGLESLPHGTNGLGVPYKWAQGLCGIDVMTPHLETQVQICQNNLETVVIKVKNRFVARLALARELNQLDKGLTVTQKMTTILSSFTSSSLHDFEKLAHGKALIDQGVVTCAHLFYRASLLSGSLKFFAYIAVSPDYPVRIPVFLLELTGKSHRTADVSVNVRDIERELNVYISELQDESELNTILTQQMYKLLSCVEVFAHAEFGSEVPGHTVFFRRNQGRTRSHPLRFITSAGGMYTHR